MFRHLTSTRSVDVACGRREKFENKRESFFSRETLSVGAVRAAAVRLSCESLYRGGSGAQRKLLLR